MTRKNIVGAIIVLMFPLLIVAELISGSIMSSLSLLLLWVACAYWRYGEGIDDSYKRECAEQAALVSGLAGFNCLLPILDTLIDALGSVVLLAYVIADLALLLRLAPRTMSALQAPLSWRFFLLQTPEPIRKHTGRE
jgi:hypothetical protein